MLPKALKSRPKSSKSPNLVTFVTSLSTVSGPTGFSPRQYRPILERSRRFEDPIEENSLSITDPLLDQKKPALIQATNLVQDGLHCLIDKEEKSNSGKQEPVNPALVQEDQPEKGADE